jgi:hypothetical protein
MNTMSEKGTLIISIPPIAETITTPELSIGHLRMLSKAEQHITVFNYRIGSKIIEASVNAPDLIPRINEAVARTDWRFNRIGVYYLLSRNTLHTIVELLDVPAFDYFYKAVATLVPNNCQDLLEDLSLGPVPHVTLYTTDPDRKAGIGINDTQELARGVLATTHGGSPIGRLHAYRLPSYAFLA